MLIKGLANGWVVKWLNERGSFYLGAIDVPKLAGLDKNCKKFF